MSELAVKQRRLEPRYMSGHVRASCVKLLILAGRGEILRHKFRHEHIRLHDLNFEQLYNSQRYSEENVKSANTTLLCQHRRHLQVRPDCEYTPRQSLTRSSMSTSNNKETAEAIEAAANASLDVSEARFRQIRAGTKQLKHDIGEITASLLAVGFSKESIHAWDTMSDAEYEKMSARLEEAKRLQAEAQSAKP